LSKSIDFSHLNIVESYMYPKNIPGFLDDQESLEALQLKLPDFRS